ncbi:acyl-CoA thioesterase [Bacillus sp. FJAT-44742]|uniref:acyl-CoA thioesterase n=1 Tax=Bacillus sp. FJAT-44742 TaxID=2014005 RepID=UPI000C246BB0|nr:thioesterase family protein [Bacillus sp. FJAT-44742]
MYISEVGIQLSYADTDMMGVIYHGNYVKWLELGRTQLIEDAGYSYLEMEKAGCYAPVHHLDITYKHAVRLGDQITVQTWVEENHRTKTIYGFSIVNQEEKVCALGSTTHIVVKKENFKPTSFKKAFPEWFQKYEEIKKSTT